MLIALAAGAVGYYLALTAPEPVLEHSGAFGITARMELDDEAIERESEPVELRYRVGDDRRIEFAVEQSDPTRRSGIVTQIAIEFDEQRELTGEGGEQEAVQFDRVYERAGVTIDEDGEPVQNDIAAQIESLLEGTRAISTVDAIGKPGEFDWRSVTNPQVRQTLGILRHGTQLLTPRMRRGAVNPGETWRYEVPASGFQSRHVQSMVGKVAVAERLVGTVERDGRRLAVIDRSLQVDASGKLEVQEISGPRAFALTGEGSGRVLFDIEAGAVVQSLLTVSRSLELEDGEGERTTREGKIELLMQVKKSG